MVGLQDSKIEQALMEAVDIHPTMDKVEIVTVVSEKLGLPRPTIRRAKKNLLLRLNEYVETLT